jgi:hypothetical protein
MGVFRSGHQNQIDDTPQLEQVCQTRARKGLVTECTGVRHRCGSGVRRLMRLAMGVTAASTPARSGRRQ